ncbi:single-stranded DNA-binding protein [Ureaplasma sp. ES3154-GEN]|uniref:single-stranded DNA-binding protein n=1 Tax=Ureaplasma sp. ES3154-GEN TaxID=2984844 RepID=UPI0021E72D6E|nr:single-stranded DNA-binding protein [Ureaplasma sp. ES3154-GEN]MCV3743733.1 single-stranded DNA-binding protein [Ureaplasma sp. ES3154-GEN]
MINKVILVGNLAKDPLPITQTSSGSNYFTRITVATSTSFSSDKTDFIPCIAWNQPADFITKYLHKGDMVTIEGSLVSSSYINKNGDKVYDLSVRIQYIRSIRRSQNNASFNTYQGNESTDFSSNDQFTSKNQFYQSSNFNSNPSTFDVSDLDDDDSYDWIDNK